MTVAIPAPKIANSGPLLNIIGRYLIRIKFNIILIIKDIRAAPTKIFGFSFASNKIEYSTINGLITIVNESAYNGIEAIKYSFP